VGVPEFGGHLTLLHERVSFKTNGHDPPQDSSTVFFLVLVCVPLVPHWWVQELHTNQELTLQARGLQGGVKRLLRRRAQKDSASTTKSISKTTTPKTFTFHIICGAYQVD